MIFKKWGLLILILLLGFSLRIYGLNWDQGFHMHPDERAIVLSILPLQWPTNLSQFLSEQSPLNTHFFAYGNFPIYFLKIVSSVTGVFHPEFTQYQEINLLGRFLSAVFDTGTIALIFFLTKKLFNKKIGLLASFFYAVSVLPIQTSHFYAVDTMLTFFILATIFASVCFYENPSKKNALLVGIFLGFALATKNSALALLSAVSISIFADFLLVFIKSPHKIHSWKHHFFITIKSIITDGILIAFVSFSIFVLFEPYAIIDAKNFLLQTAQQYAMTHNAFTFPYTLQYVGKVPYVYEVKNILLWGQGIAIGVLSFLGVIYFTFIAIKKHKYSSSEAGNWQQNSSRQARTINPWAQEIILAVFFWSYFLVVGKFAIGFMRYMLPLYPFLSIFAAVFFYKLLMLIPKKLQLPFAISYMLFATIWPVSFMHIYSQPNTRVVASNWIHQNIPPGSTLAVEHWDDGLPLFGQENYQILTLPLYDPDTPEKWGTINMSLQKTDYIIIASNRLYVPLQKLADCTKFPIYHCYPVTATYYQNLFHGNLGYKKVAEFSLDPTIPLLQIPINDQGADESFTVYDHPKVILFKKI